MPAPQINIQRNSAELWRISSAGAIMHQDVGVPAVVKAKGAQEEEAGHEPFG